MDSLKEACSLIEREMREEVCYKSITENVYKILKCFKCGEYCHPPFKQTKNAKLVCSLCLQKHGKSADCELISPQPRIFLLEKIYANIEFPCENHLYGCSYKGIGSTLDDHRKLCEYVSTYCHIESCSWRGRPREIHDHFENNHSCLRTTHPSMKCNTFNCKSGNNSEERHVIFTSICYVVRYGKVFVFNLVKNNLTKTWKYRVTNMEPFDISKYEFVLNFGIVKQRSVKITLKVAQSDNLSRMKMDSFPYYDLPPQLITRKFKIEVREKA